MRAIAVVLIVLGVLLLCISWTLDIRRFIRGDESIWVPLRIGLVILPGSVLIGTGCWILDPNSTYARGGGWV